jgi:membrane-associated HD superfamily phosphohydrolase
VPEIGPIPLARGARTTTTSQDGPARVLHREPDPPTTSTRKSGRAISATVIAATSSRIEKARRLGLPKQVVDIIAEHHGNSVISWFYHEAVKREDQVSADDFSYPGTPPKSKESAVVMLADTVEAAVRTLKKPTMSKLDKFVQELIMSKFEQDQLSESDLTFKDLETIKNSFVRVLAGHYHSRIEYPKLKEKVG